MRRMTWLVLACLAYWGCNRASPPSPPPAQAGPAATAPTPTATPTAGPPQAATVPAATKTPPSASAGRELVARYLDSDGQGGWRVNEKAATDLEKLSPSEVAELWPRLKDPKVEVRRGAAVFLLNQFDPSNREHVAAFAALLDDGDRLVRARALDAVH